MPDVPGWATEGLHVPPSIRAGADLKIAHSAALSQRRRAALLVIALAAAPALAVGSLSSGRLGIVSGCLLIMVTCLPLIGRLRIEPLDGPGIYGLITFATFGVTSLAWLGKPDDPGPWLTREDIGLPLLLVASAVVAFFAGARLVGPVRRARGPHSSVAPLPPAVFMGAYAGITAVALFGLITGTYGYTVSNTVTPRSEFVASALPFVAQLGRVIILCVAIEAIRTNQKRLKQVLLVLLTAHAAVGLAAGFKSEILYPFALVSLVFLASRQSLPRRGILAVALFTLFIVLPANRVYRDAVRDESSPSATTVLREMSDPRNYRPDEALGDAPVYLATRFRNIDHVALISRDTPEVYAAGTAEPYLLLPAMMVIPRQIWGDKPVLDLGAQFAHTYWEIPVSIRTSQPVTQIGDLRRTFGVAGVWTGLAVWGSLIAGWTVLWRKHRSLRWDAIYIYLAVTAIAYVEVELPFVLVSAAKVAPMVVIMSWLLLPGASTPSGYRLIIDGVRARVFIRQNDGAHVPP